MLMDKYAEHIISAVSEISREERVKIMQAAELASAVIEKDGLIYIFGCGHSGILSCEGFYRAGGLACVAPVFCEPIMLHEGAAESSRLEKLSGYAERLKNMYTLESRDMMFIVSTSDKNAVPVEYAEHVSSLGIPTVAICSSAYFGQEVHNASGRHLHEVCTMYIDNHAPFGDACLRPEGAAAAMTPLSTVTGVYILNSVLAQATELAISKGVDVPIYLSGNIPGGAERNKALIRRFQPRIPHL